MSKFMLTFCKKSTPVSIKIVISIFTLNKRRNILFNNKKMKQFLINNKKIP